MPDEFGGLPEDGGDGVKRVVIAIAARKDDNAKFHGSCCGEVRLYFIRHGWRGGFQGTKPNLGNTQATRAGSRPVSQSCGTNPIGRCGMVVRAWAEEADLGPFGCWIEGHAYPSTVVPWQAEADRINR